MHHNMSYPSITTHRSECLFLRRLGPRLIGRYAPLHHKKRHRNVTRKSKKRVAVSLFFSEHPKKRHRNAPRKSKKKLLYLFSEQQNHLNHCISANY